MIVSVRLSTAVLLACCALTLGGCGNDAQDSATHTSQGAVTSGAPATPASDQP